MEEGPRPGRRLERVESRGLTCRAEVALVQRWSPNTLVWAPSCQAIPDSLPADLEARSPAPFSCRRSRLANGGRLDAENEVGEIRLTWCARMVAILVTDRPVREGSLQAALRGIQRASRNSLVEPYPRLSARLVQPLALVVAGPYPVRVAHQFVARVYE